MISDFRKTLLIFSVHLLDVWQATYELSMFTLIGEKSQNPYV